MNEQFVNGVTTGYLSCITIYCVSRYLLAIISKMYNTISAPIPVKSGYNGEEIEKYKGEE